MRTVRKKARDTVLRGFTHVDGIPSQSSLTRQYLYLVVPVSALSGRISKTLRDQ
jgi:hypothetical protein